MFIFWMRTLFCFFGFNLLNWFNQMNYFIFIFLLALLLLIVFIWIDLSWLRLWNFIGKANSTAADSGRWWCRLWIIPLAGLHSYWFIQVIWKPILCNSGLSLFSEALSYTLSHTNTHFYIDLIVINMKSSSAFKRKLK